MKLINLVLLLSIAMQAKAVSIPAIEKPYKEDSDYYDYTWTSDSRGHCYTQSITTKWFIDHYKGIVEPIEYEVLKFVIDRNGNGKFEDEDFLYKHGKHITDKKEGQKQLNFFIRKFPYA